NDKKITVPKKSRTAPKRTATKKKKKKKKSLQAMKKKHPVLFGVFLSLFCLFVSAVLTCIIVGSSVLSYVNAFVDGKTAVDLDNYKSSQSQTSIMYAYNSKNKPVEQTRLHGSENRIWVDYDEMPENLLWAFVCLEDKRFYEHSGVDWVRTIGVLVKPKLNGQGGSTITQQLIKNLTGQNSATYNRKFNEIMKALNLEKEYSKKDILEAYLNTVYLGAGCYGVKTAAETYFNKEVKDLTLEECAILASVTKSPYTINPFVNYEKTIDRQQLCLWYMWKQGKITEERYNKALKTKVKLAEKKNASTSSNNTKTEVLSWYEEYVIDNVISDLQTKYGYEYNEAWRMVYYGGLSIYSAVDLDVQKKLEDIYAKRSGFPYSSKDKKGNLPESSMVIMDYQGRIVALVGGTGDKTQNRVYNRATDKRAKRQPGSSIKPLAVYAPAIEEKRISPSSTILEKAITVDGSPWPRNFNGDHGSGNYITAQEALVRSLNTVPVRIVNEMLGLKTSLTYCNEKFHLNLSDSDMTLSGLAVGGTYTGVTTLEMAAAFATFGNGGRYYQPYSYYKVVDRNGEVLLDNTKNEPERAISAATANSTLSMLTKAVTQSNGTGYGSAISGFQTFAKTGTTSDNCDKWYCGGTPHYVCSVWYGYDYRADLHTGSTNPAKTIFKYVFSDLHKGLKSKTFKDVLIEVGADKSEINAAVKEVKTSEETTVEETTTVKETTEKKTTEPKTTEKPKPSTTKPPETTKVPETTAPPTTTNPPTTTKPPETTAPPPVTTVPPTSSEPVSEPLPQEISSDEAA
ncbi:MAG: transglycosylase domain-containing protein, partial [Faecalibacterium sp.]|nr:transglycosylase domain-containing protein [Faecalibacterium sp.]